MSQTPQWPEEDEGRLLHVALFSTDSTAISAFAEAFYGPLCAHLTRSYPHVAEDLLVSVASDLILKLVQEPEGYDPEQLPVCAFLRMAARKKLSTATERDTRRRRREVPIDFVAELPAPRNNRTADDEPSWAHPLLAAEIAAFAPAEQRAFELLRDGVRDTAAFARALDLDPQQPDAARAVKRLKDTIKARLRRAVGDRP
ncbi:MAG TPA: hypothetical protein VGE74_05590 [Gemmata sp.]